MADPDLISAYLTELRLSLARLIDADVERMVEEAEDHLRETASQLERSGETHHHAEALALARFGSPTLVAKVCITESRKGAAVSTTFTRRAGLVALFTPVPLVAGMIGNAAFYHDKEGLRGTLHGSSSGLLLPIGLLGFLLGLAGLRARHRGLGRLGRLALLLVVAAPLVAFPFGWGAGYVATLVLSLAVIVAGIAMLRAGVLPVAPLVAFVLGAVLFIAIGVSLVFGGGDPEIWVLAAPLTLTIGATSWLGWYQWREPALDDPGTSGLSHALS